VVEWGTITDGGCETYGYGCMGEGSNFEKDLEISVHSTDIDFGHSYE